MNKGPPTGSQTPMLRAGPAAMVKRADAGLGQRLLCSADAPCRHVGPGDQICLSRDTGNLGGLCGHSILRYQHLISTGHRNPVCSWDSKPGESCCPGPWASRLSTGGVAGAPGAHAQIRERLLKPRVPTLTASSCLLLSRAWPLLGTVSSWASWFSYEASTSRPCCRLFSRRLAMSTLRT